MDNAGCHPPDLKCKYSNIKILFLPPNTTSKLQPLDLGIIQNFKVYYRKSLLQFVVAKIDEFQKATDNCSISDNIACYPLGCPSIKVC